MEKWTAKIDSKAPFMLPNKFYLLPYQSFTVVRPRLEVPRLEVEDVGVALMG
jgi:hypothetical protein